MAAEHVALRQDAQAVWRFGPERPHVADARVAPTLAWAPAHVAADGVARIG
jgi:hypothetical protein